MSDDRSRHETEAAFHDRWAAEVPVEQIAVREAFESPTAIENQFILRQMGKLKNIDLLDIGTGLGESAVYFALQGARVTATDIAPMMIDRARQLAAFHGVKLEPIVTAAEVLDVGDRRFDLVYIANTIHHVADRAALFRNIHRVLRPGGRIFSIDPLAYNPVINVYRRMATAVRTPDERPLTFADVELARKFFPTVRHREFQIATLALFVKYYLLDRVHPNAERYWKRIYEETAVGLWWWRPLRELDRVLTRLPLLRRMAWNMVMWGQREK